MFWNNSCKFYNYLKRSARLSPSSRGRNSLCRRIATSIYSCLILQKTLHCTRKQRSRLLRYFLVKSIIGCVKFKKRTELWIDFWQFNHIFEPFSQSELIIWKTDSRFFFSLASPALRIQACEAHALALTLLLRNSKPVLGKKNRRFCSLKSERHWR